MTEPPPAGSPPKLIIITHEFAPFRGGVATYVEEVAAALQKLGAAVEVWAPDYGQPATKDHFSFPVVRLHDRAEVCGRDTPAICKGIGGQAAGVGKGHGNSGQRGRAHDHAPANPARIEIENASDFFAARFRVAAIWAECLMAEPREKTGFRAWKRWWRIRSFQKALVAKSFLRTADSQTGDCAVRLQQRGEGAGSFATPTERRRLKARVHAGTDSSAQGPTGHGARTGATARGIARANRLPKWAARATWIICGDSRTGLPGKWRGL